MEKGVQPMRPTVLFVCVHNAGRSQMAAGFLHHLILRQNSGALSWLGAN